MLKKRHAPPLHSSQDNLHTYVYGQGDDETLGGGATGEGSEEQLRSIGEGTKASENFPETLLRTYVKDDDAPRHHEQKTHSASQCPWAAPHHEDSSVSPSQGACIEHAQPCVHVRIRT